MSGLDLRHTQSRRHEEDATIAVDERAAWLIDYILLHQNEGRTELVRKAVDQFLAAEAAAYLRGRRAAWRSRHLQRRPTPVRESK